jgi:peptidoglycan/xylan/chitin deacetylase (PgdA/CDA1 family)
MAVGFSENRGSGPYGRNGMIVRVVYLLFAAVYSLCCLISSRRGRIVLCYHAVQDSQAKRFTDQMRFLKGRVFPIGEIHEKPSGVFVTFDDAFACLLQNVVPLATEFKIPIAIFPVTENDNQPPRWNIAKDHPEAVLRTMSESELASLREFSVATIGSHTATHPRLGDIPATIAERELRTSRDSLAALLGFIPSDLALPHGSYNLGVLESARELGYKRVFTVEPNINTTLPADGRIGRFVVDPDMWLIEFKLTVIGAYGYLLSFRRLINSLRKSQGSAFQSNS